MKNKKLRIPIICKKCNTEFEVIPSRMNSAKYCSSKCSNNRIRTEEELLKISNASKQKFIDNPVLLKNQAELGRKLFKKMNDDGKAFRMPIGYHTEAHKQYMSELMSNRIVSSETCDKIKENHWSNSSNSDNVIKKIKNSKKTSKKWNSYERKNQLANWSLEHPEKCGPKFYKRGIYKSKKTGINEYYASGFELEYMKKYDMDDSVLFWTKKHKIQIDYMYQSKLHKYTPDFFVKYDIGEIFLIELKGRIYNQEIINIKNKEAIKYCSNNNLQYDIIYQNKI